MPFDNLRKLFEMFESFKPIIPYLIKLFEFIKSFDAPHQEKVVEFLLDLSEVSTEQRNQIKPQILQLLKP